MHPLKKNANKKYRIRNVKVVDSTSFDIRYFLFFIISLIMQVYPLEFVYKKLPHFLKNCAFPLGKSLNASIQKGLGDLIIKFRGKSK